MSGHGSGRQERGRSMPCMGPANGAESIGRAVHEIAAVAAVHVDVDEARSEVAVAEIDDGIAGGRLTGADIRNVVAGDADDGVIKDSIRQNDLAAECEHGVALCQSPMRRRDKTLTLADASGSALLNLPQSPRGAAVSIVCINLGTPAHVV